MKELFLLLSWLVQLVVALVVGLWLVAFLGFADEATRRKSANWLGKCLVSLRVLLAVTPVGVTLWVG